MWGLTDHSEHVGSLVLTCEKNHMGWRVAGLFLICVTAQSFGVSVDPLHVPLTIFTLFLMFLVLGTISLSKQLHFHTIQITIQKWQRTAAREPISKQAGRKLLWQVVKACCSIDRIVMIVLVKVMPDKC